MLQKEKKHKSNETIYNENIWFDYRLWERMQMAMDEFM